MSIKLEVAHQLCQDFIFPTSSIYLSTSPYLLPGIHISVCSSWRAAGSSPHSSDQLWYAPLSGFHLSVSNLTWRTLQQDILPGSRSETYQFMNIDLWIFWNLWVTVSLIWILLTSTKYDVGVPPGYVAFSPEEAESVAKKLSMISIYKHCVNIITKLGRKWWSGHKSSSSCRWSRERPFWPWLQGWS